MAYNLTRKNIESFIENNDTRRILEIYSESTSKEQAEVMDRFIKADGYKLTHEQMVKLASIDIANCIRELDMKSLEKSFVPISESNDKGFKDLRLLKAKYKDNINMQSYTTLKQIFYTSKDDYYLGLYNAQYIVDQVLENGVSFGKNAKFQRDIKNINHFDNLINEIINSDSIKQSRGSFIIRVPKEAITKKSMPIYYINDGFIYLNPEYVVCYVMVKDRKILNVEINRSMNEVESTLYDGDSIIEDKRSMGRRK